MFERHLYTDNGENIDFGLKNNAFFFSIKKKEENERCLSAIYTENDENVDTETRRELCVARRV